MNIVEIISGSNRLTSVSGCVGRQLGSNRLTSVSGCVASLSEQSSPRAEHEIVGRQLGSIVPIETLDDLICFFLANKRDITNLYCYLDNFLRLREAGKFGCFTFMFPGIVKKRYTTIKLINLYCQADNDSISDLCQEVCTLRDSDCDAAIDAFVKILFKIRKPVQELYMMVNRSSDIRGTTLHFCYTFRNPLRECVKVTPNKKKFINCELLKFVCLCRDRKYKIVCEP